MNTQLGAFPDCHLPDHTFKHRQFLSRAPVNQALTGRITTTRRIMTASTALNRLYITFLMRYRARTLVLERCSSVCGTGIRQVRTHVCMSLTCASTGTSRPHTTTETLTASSSLSRQERRAPRGARGRRGLTMTCMHFGIPFQVIESADVLGHVNKS